MQVRRLCFLLVGWGLLISATAQAQAPAMREIVIVSGGPALRYYERHKKNSHDKAWGNFIVAAQLQIKKLQTEHPDWRMTWLVFRPGYRSREAEQGEPLLTEIQARATKLGANLMWFDKTDQLVNYLNAGQDRRRMPIGRFDYFGHSNRACFMFDYSNDVDSMSTERLHETSLSRIRRDIFAKDGTAQSWGCHSGESYSTTWKQRFGVPMLGAVGKTDYSNGALPFISSEGGRWVQ